MNREPSPANGDQPAQSDLPAQPDLERPGAQLFAGPAGAMEVLIDRPGSPPRGLVLIGHPQPLLGGTARHKVPHFLARSLAEDGWLVVRPNFRGAGRSAGSHDHGLGEADDMLALHDTLVGQRPALRLALVGFSFGAYVMARLARALADRGQPADRVCLAGMPSGEVESGRQFDTPTDLPNALIVHGEQDDWVSLQSVLDWARPQAQPVVVVPGADHFFSGQLPVLRDLMLRHLDQLA